MHAKIWGSCQISFPLFLSAKAPKSGTLFSNTQQSYLLVMKFTGHETWVIQVSQYIFVFPKCSVCFQSSNIFTVQLRKACIQHSNIKYLELCDSDLELSFGVKLKVKLLLLISSKEGGGELCPLSSEADVTWAKSICHPYASTKMTAVGSHGWTPQPSFHDWDFDGVSKVDLGGMQAKTASLSEFPRLQ